VDRWTLIRFGHLAGILFFVGGQLVLVAAITPVLGDRDPETMRAIARRFGIGSLIALAIIVATGVALASRFDSWDDAVLQGKLMLLVLVGVLTALHIMSSKTRAISLAIVATSLAIVWLGLELAHG
jgi:uncharacterized membrane protein